MTEITDRETSFTWEVQRYESGWVDLPAVNVTTSIDMDRVPYCTATVEVAGIDYATVLALDPRRDASGFVGNVIRIRVLEFDEAGDFRANLVRNMPSPESQWATLVIRRVTYDHLTRDATIELGGRESILDDRRRISGTSIDTGATDALELVYWSLTDTFGGYTVTTVGSDASNSAIPAGDRRLFLPGESHSDLLEPELQAAGCRLYDYWGNWWVNRREDTPLLGVVDGYERTVQLSSYTQREGAPPNADPILYEVSETFDRSGDYADGVLIKFDTSESGGSTAYQRSGTGANTKGRVITWKRAAPSSNAADEVVKRTKIRGRDLRITARARLDITPGQTIRAFLRDDLEITANVRAVEWNIADAEMTIRAQAGRPEE